MSELFTPENESAVLSTLLKNPDVFTDVGTLQSFMFSSTPYKLLYEVITELNEQNLVPDQNLLSQFIKAKGLEAQTGGDDLLKYLYGLTYPVENVGAYVKLIKDAYKARSILSLGSELNNAKLTSDNLDDVIGKFREKFDRILELATTSVLFGMKEIMKAGWENLGKRISNPGISGYTTGLRSLDAATSGMCANELWIIAGRPSSGKSAVMCNLALNQALQQLPVTIFSLEMSKEIIHDRLMSTFSGIPLGQIRLGTLSQAEIDKLEKAHKILSGIPLYVSDSPVYNHEQLYPEIRRAVKSTGSKVIYIDYLQLATERGEDQTAELGRITRRLKLLSKELNVCFVALSQLNREVEKRDDKRPILSDMKQSGSIEDDADVAIGLYRDYYYTKLREKINDIELIILKQRNGPVGTVLGKFTPETNKIDDK